ncbi:MAG: choice-of-anchor J domain-containing protein [Psychroflexus halocasei]
MNPFDSFEAFQANCTSPQATTSIDEDCVNGVYTINVDVTDMGDATSLTITNDLGAPDMPVTETGVVSFGPIPVGTVINLVLEHDQDSQCNVDLGAFKDTCPAPNDTIAGAIPITPSAAGTGCDTFTFAYDYGDGSVSDSGLDGSCDGSNTGYDLFFSWTATSAALIWNVGLGGPGIVIRQADGTEITCESTSAPEDTVLSGWDVGDDLIIQVYDYGSAAELVSFCLEELTCPAPTSLQGTSITSDEADLTWQANGAETEWTVIWGEEGFDPETEGTTVTDDDGDAGISLTGLTELTAYEFYVQANCGVGDESGFSGPQGFTTSCEAISDFPLTQNFDGNWSGSPEAPLCWKVINNDDDTNTWTKSATYITPRSGSSVAHGMGNSDDYLVTPALEFSATDEMQIRWFDIVDSSSQNNTYDVLVSTTDSDVSSFTENLGTYDTTNEEWEERELDLSAYAGETIYVAFHQTQSASSIYGFGIDDVTIEEIPTCLKPQNVAVSTPTTTSVDLSWDEEPGATNGYELSAFEIDADPYTDAPVSTVTVAAGETTGTVTGLSASTFYDFYVASDCDADGMSAYSDPAVSMRTQCEAITSFPLMEDFDGAWQGDPAAPGCWSVVNNDEDGYTWSKSAQYITPRSGSSVAHGTGNGDDYLISPALELPAGDAMQMKWYDVVEGATHNNTYEVLVSTTDKEISSFTENLGTYDVTNTDWEEHILDLSDYAGSTIYIAFHQTYSDATNWGFGIEDFSVEETPTCFAPEGLEISNITGSSFDLSWEAESTEVDGYEWIVMSEGEDPEADTPVESGATAAGETSATITGLSETTTYDVYIRTNCDVEGVSVYSDVITMTTTENCAAPTSVMFDESTVTTTTAEFSWEVSATEALGYEWIVMAEGDDPEADTPVESGTTDPGETSVTVTDLMASTAYEFYILSNCDSDGMSDYASPVSFSTACGVITPDYLEDFSNFLPTCWEVGKGGDFAAGPDTFGSSVWGADGFLNDGTSGAARVNLYATSREEWLISPAFDLSADGYELVFDTGITDYYNQDPSAMGSDDELYVLYTTDGTTWTELQSWEAGNEPANAGETVIIDLAGISGSEVKFAFYATDGDVSDSEDYNIYIDNFKVRTPLTCPEIQELTVSSVTATEAELSWMDNAEAVNGYVWSVFEEGEDPETATAVATGTTAAGVATVMVSDLALSTSYDAYVQADCDVDGMSPLSAPVNFTTLVTAIIVTPGTTETITHCYENYEFTEWIFESSDGSPLTIEFEQGTLETNFSGGTDDDLMIYDGNDDTGIVLYDSDNPTSDAGELEGLIFVAESGMLYMTLDSNVSNSCESGSQTEIIFNVDAGTASNSDFFSEANFSYYPNPVESRFVINSTYELEQIVIYNMLGQEVRDISPQSTEVSFDLSDVQAGVYLVKATVEGQVQTFRLIKE